MTHIVGLPMYQKPDGSQGLMWKPGFDILGAAHPLFPRSVVDSIERDRPVGWFWNQFGESKELFKWMLTEGFLCFRPQMWWGGDAHVIAPMNVLKVELQELAEVFEPYKGSRVLYVSPSCEHAERNPNRVIEGLELVREIIPYAYVVNNPWKGVGAAVPNWLLEYHGAQPGLCDLASTDGTNIYDIDAEPWCKKYGWKEHPCLVHSFRYNGREIPDPGQKPPPISKRRAFPDQKYQNANARITLPRGPLPDTIHPSLKKARPLKDRETYKTHAEDDQEPNEYTPDELRENRPVLIIAPNVRSVDVLASDGSSLGMLPRYGKGADFNGLTRFYSGLPGGAGLYGFQFGNKAKKKTGSEWVWFKAGSTIIGPIHPAFRTGTTRLSSKRKSGRKSRKA